VQQMVGHLQEPLDQGMADSSTRRYKHYLIYTCSAQNDSRK
jgi:hypothetical protein